MTRILPLLLPFVLAALLVPGVRGEDEASTHEPASYLRLEQEGESVLRLDIAARTFTPLSGAGPAVTLVGVSHVADAAFYEKIQALLDAHDVVLFESVLPPGAGDLAGEDDAEKTAATAKRLRFLAAAARSMLNDGTVLPETFEALVRAAGAVDGRLGHYLLHARADAWARPIEMRTTTTEGAEARTAFVSLGADGLPGGEGTAADLVVAVDAEVEPLPLAATREFDLMRAFAKALDFTYQLEGIDYQRPHWLVSDMDLDQVRAAAKARGGDFSAIESTLTMEGLDPKAIEQMLKMLEGEGNPFGGAIRPVIKSLIVTVLASDLFDRPGAAGVDKGTMDAIVIDRNTVVLEDLEALVAERPDLSRVALFYGAGHMKDMEKRLVEEMGYRAAGTEWLPAIVADLSDSPFPPAMLEGIRKMAERLIKERAAAKPEGAPNGE